MAHVRLRGDEVDLDEPYLVEGLPGVGLVGKIATDHLVEQFDMEYYASVHCDGLPRIGVYQDGDRSVRPPVRLYADEERDLLALQSDVPVSAENAGDFADCVTGWIDDNDATPLYLSGRPAEKDGDVPALFGVGTGDGGEWLNERDIDTPSESGAIAGPTGALIARSAENDLDSVGLIVESDPQFPDPEAARVLIDRGIAPLANVDADVSNLVDRAEEIRQQKEQLAQRMGQADEDESSQAQPLRMFQ
ncbi:proteasome assembly chaperone family protein [Halostella sp. JP-L12]|uniref:proteasome assembly chaperone family protein n=1 Tax=Halostella TaxID=1843185 RepID=UPI000EF77D6F|nr:MULTISPECIES: PAC2 family protein [Halostella]NHN47735.1 proteasome assembly chaperone family protein [Halostella sp. JP-L12]